MALRTPSRYTPQWYYEPKLEYVEPGDPGIEFRTLTIKLWDWVDIPTRRQDTFNNEVAVIEYEVEGKLITITNWQHTWRDEWPIRLGFQYIRNCLYKPGQGIVFRVEKDPEAFWVSEGFLPVTGKHGLYLETVPLWVP